MKVIRLKSENVMRLVAVDITPEGALVTIGGKNGAGKSSVLNSLAMALGGKSMAPEEPIRTGETQASVWIDLGDLRVTRRFMRDVLHAEGCGNGTDVTTPDTPVVERPKLLKCACAAFGEVRSSLMVTNKDGAQYPSPQALLDKLLGKLTFDPLEFARNGTTAEGRRQQAETLRRLVGIDLSTFDLKAKAAREERTMTKKTHAIKEAQAAALLHHEDAPKEETPLTTEKLLEAERLRKIAEEAEHTALRASDQHGAALRQADAYREQVLDLERQIQEVSDKRRKADELTSIALREKTFAQDAAKDARSVVPDVAAISAEMDATEKVNVKVRDNIKKAAADAEVEALANAIAELDNVIETADAEKAHKIKSAKFPVEGLGLSDDGVTFAGLPFSQASTAEQLRVSVAVGLAINPTLKVLLVRSGNLLDDDSLAAVAAQAEAADAQVWCEYVTKDASAVQVFIEDGQVVEHVV